MRGRAPLRRGFPFARHRLLALRAAALVAAALVSVPPPACAGSLDVSVSSHYSVGGYGGTRDVDVVYLPVELRYETSLWSFEAVVPWIRVSGGSAIVETPGGPIETKGGTNDGIGDLILETRRSFEPLAQLAPWITLGARVKIPTADEHKGLGTGNWDLTPGFELAQRYGRWTPFLTVAYRILGNSGGVAYRDGFVASAGSLYRVFGATEVGLFVDWRQAASGDSVDSLELLPMLRIRLAEDWTVDAYASAGLSDAVPDVGTGLEIRYRLVDRP